ncbi:MAG: FecR domain-containing protein [Muribaculaceae bacterium]|nr:FecR domain-containing protein [Muribaculaceae bacterium]
MTKDYEKIIDFIYNHPAIPDELKTTIQEWMLAHQNEPDLNQSMLAIWDEEFGKDAGNVNAEALTRLLNDISSQKRVKKARPLFRLSGILKYAAVVAAIFLSSVITYIVTTANAPQETILTTAKGSTGEFTLPDGTMVKLNSDTRLAYDAATFMTSDKRRVKVDGEAFFEVTKDAGHPFVVTMTEMEVEVLGTSFDVRNYPFCTNEEVVLLSGKVRIDSKDMEEPVTMMPDQRMVLDRHTGKYSIEQTSAANYCRWIEPKLKLENEPLGNILVTLGRKYCLDIDIADNVDVDRRVSLTIGNDDLDDVLEVLSYLTDIRCFVENNTLYIK